MNKIEHNDMLILDNFAQCCATCVNRPFVGGYSGTKNCGYCSVVGTVVHRCSVCDNYENDQKAKNGLLGSMKSQSKWIKSK